MKAVVLSLLASVLSLPVCVRGNNFGAQSDTAPAERLGVVSFATSCSPSLQTSFNRGVALLHDFWYGEAEAQFERIAKADPGCAIAHWGIAMSQFHQIWNRPDQTVMKRGWSELQKAQSPPAKTERERDFISALSSFYQPGKKDYLARAEAYSAAMSSLYRRYPNDTDAGAFYALSLLADEAPADTSLSHQHKALEILTSLFAKNPDHPGVAHYIIHACDNPPLARQGLEAARRYGVIAPGAPHAAHMPSHIFARLGMWQEDIDANLASVAASQRAAANHQSGAFDQLHADDFLLYAYLQSGQDARAKSLLGQSSAVVAQFESMPDMVTHGMNGMLPYYRTKFPVIYDLEMRDWKSAAALQPVPSASTEVQTLTYWARAVAAGHLRQPEAARADLKKYDELIEQLRNSSESYVADSTGARVERGEVLAWAAFAEGNNETALNKMRETADLQDKVGQAEVDIPAREMLADMLVALNQPQQALMEYDLALKVSPNRFNGLFNAGRAAEAVSDEARAGRYYSALLKSTGNGSQSERVEFAHVRSFFHSTEASGK